MYPVRQPILNVIHLPGRIDRLQSLTEECAEQNLMFQLWDGVDRHKMAVRNINEAHKQIVKVAKEGDWPFVAIAEDDIRFSCRGSWLYFLSKMPKIFDLYCGLMYAGEVDHNNKVISKGMSGTNTLYVVHQRFYDFFLATDNTKNLDRELGNFSNINEYYICNPMVCYQSGGYSDNLKRNMTYEPYLEGKKLFGQ